MAWGYTPRELAGWAALIAESDRHEMARELSVQAQAARGDPKKLNETIKKLSK